MINILLNHRSIRRYQDTNVSGDDLDQVLNAGIRASTTGNMQVYSIIVTRDQKVKDQLSPFHFNQPMIKEAPVVLTFCADYNRFNKWCKRNDAVPGYDNFLSFMTGAIDALLVAQNVCVAAESKGMGICYLGTTLYMAKGIIDTLNLPRGVVPIVTVTLGWPAEEPEQVDRLPLEAVVHQEVYHDYSDNTIRRLYADKENRKDNRQFVTENNKKSLAQVFTDIRYTKEDNLNFSRQLLEVLNEQGFMNQ